MFKKLGEFYLPVIKKVLNIINIQKKDILFKIFFFREEF